MSMKVMITVQVSNMDGSDVIHVAQLDTSINPNPRDPTNEALLLLPVLERLLDRVHTEAKERVHDYGEAIVRLISGGSDT